MTSLQLYCERILAENLVFDFFYNIEFKPKSLDLNCKIFVQIRRTLIIVLICCRLPSSTTQSCSTGVQSCTLRCKSNSALCRVELSHSKVQLQRSTSQSLTKQLATSQKRLSSDITNKKQY